MCWQVLGSPGKVMESPYRSVGLMVATLARFVVKPVVGMKWRIPAPPLQSCWYQVVPVLRMPGAWFSACDG